MRARVAVVAAIAVLICLAASTQIDWNTQIKNKPIIDARDFIFTVSPAGSVSIGANSKEIRPCPTGVNWTDVDHYVYISGGDGIPEAVKITGGTCTSGALTGTITFTAVNTHTGAWNIQSASGGIQEALQAAGTAGGGRVNAQKGTIVLHAAVQIPSRVALVGYGQGSTILKAADGELGRTALWQNSGAPSGYYCIVCAVAGGTNIVVRDLTVDENGANQTYKYISGDIGAYQVTNSLYTSVSVINRMKGGTGVGMAFYGGTGGVGGAQTNVNNTVENATVRGLASCTAPNGGGGYYVEGQFNRIVNTYAYDVCDTAWVVVGNHHSVIGAHGDTGTGVESTPMFTVLGSYNLIADSHCSSTGGGAIFSCFEVGGPGVTSVGNVFANDIAIGTSNQGAFEINDITFGAGIVKDTTFSNITVQGGCVTGIDIQIGVISNVTIAGAHIVGCTYAGINIVSPVVGVGAAVNGVEITGSYLDHNNLGILVQSGQTDLIKNFNLTGNFIGDTSGSPIEGFGVYLDAGTLTGFTAQGNIMKGALTGPFQIIATLADATIGPNDTSSLIDNGVYHAMGAPVSSGSSITATGSIFHVTGTAAIATIVGGALNGHLTGCITIIPDGVFTWTTGANIALAGTAVVGKQLQMCYDPAAVKWFPSY